MLEEAVKIENVNRKCIEELGIEWHKSILRKSAKRKECQMKEK